ncbi:MAG: diaminopimelate decarboxylase [Candidatus Hydrogenedentota bacterium]|nr:MAG: diaminopimelate decarboxylase [Candidatus Hydrogenedentota bacterium]
MYSYKNKTLYWQNDSLTEVAAQAEQLLKEKYAYEGAYYLYSMDVFRSQIGKLKQNLPQSRFFYSVKSQSHSVFLSEIDKHENFGFDVVSGGEIYRTQAINIDPRKIVFAGVGKTKQEIHIALQLGIYAFHVESISELKAIAEQAKSLNKIAPVTLRMNPEIEVDTHKYITTGMHENKFGINVSEFADALEFCKQDESLHLIGLQAHLGSQLLDETVYEKALLKLESLGLAAKQAGCPVQYYSLGGGFGIDYETDADSKPHREFALDRLQVKLKPYFQKGIQIDFEPGRFLSAYSGILVTHVLYTKQKQGFTIAIVDAGMNDFIRPALYEANHPILPETDSKNRSLYDIVGPVCESGDFFRKKIMMPKLSPGDRLFLLHAGAYGQVMSSTYNSRPMLPEVLLDKGHIHIISRPGFYSDLLVREV